MKESNIEILENDIDEFGGDFYQNNPGVIKS